MVTEILAFLGGIAFAALLVVLVALIINRAFNK